MPLLTSSRRGSSEEPWERCLRLAKEYDQSSMDIDQCSRFIFPVAFIIWNAFYWGYYLWYTAPY
jgi:hypothetical protein